MKIFSHSSKKFHSGFIPENKHAASRGVAEVFSHIGCFVGLSELNYGSRVGAELGELLDAGSPKVDK